MSVGTFGGASRRFFLWRRWMMRLDREQFRYWVVLVILMALLVMCAAVSVARWM